MEDKYSWLWESITEHFRQQDERAFRAALRKAEARYFISKMGEIAGAI